MSDRSEHARETEAALREALSTALLEGARDAKNGVRKQVLSAARSDARYAQSRTLAARASAVLVAVTLLAGGASVAAATADPGQPAYALKRAAERTALALLPPGALRDALLVRFEQRRADELVELMSKDLSDADLWGALRSMGVPSGGTAPTDPYDALRREMERLQPGEPDAPAQGEGGMTEDNGRQLPRGPAKEPSSSPGSGASDGVEPAPGPSTGEGGGSCDSGGSGSGSPGQGPGGSVEPTGEARPGLDHQSGGGVGPR